MGVFHIDESMLADRYDGFCELKGRIAQLEGGLQVSRKAWSYFLDIVDSEDFRSEMRKLKIKYGYPEHNLDDRIRYHELPNDNFTYQDVKKDLLLLEEKYGFANYGIADVLEEIFDGSARDWFYPLSVGGACKLCDDSSYDFSDKEYFPISVRISPYASKNDIIDLVNKTYKDIIQPIQKKYQKEGVCMSVKRGRSKEVRKKYDFVFKNRQLPLEQIRKNISEELGLALDTGEIAKMISLEKKRRGISS